MGLNRSSIVLAGSIAAALAGAIPCAAQTEVRSVRFSADLTADASSVEVRVEYTLTSAERGPARFQLLGFGRATAETFSLAGDGPARHVPLAPRSGSLRTAEIGLGPSVTGSDLRIAAAYRVASAVERDGPRVRVHLPVLTLALPPEAGAADVFTADLTLPDGWRISESFPSGLRGVGGNRHSVTLPAAPSVVILHARSDDAWRPGLPLALDLAAALVVLSFGLIGWRHLRRLAAAPEATATRR